MRREEEIQRRAEKAVKLAEEKRRQREEEKARLREVRLGETKVRRGSLEDDEMIYIYIRYESG